MPKLNLQKNLNDNSNFKKISWDNICADIKIKLGNDIYDSWIKKLSLVEELEHYIVLSSPTRFIRDWIVSRYIDQILEIIKTHKKKYCKNRF